MVADLIHVKYTEHGARAVLQEGFRSRRAEVQRIAEQYGERLAGYWVTDDGEWDVVFVLEAPDDGGHPGAGVVANLRGQASGSIARIRRTRLYSPEAVDADLDLIADMHFAGDPRTA
jgi:uncharacterized protein with GYD domain